MKTLNLIGAGRVGQTLGRLFQAAGVFQVQGVLTRNAETARQAVAFIGAGQPCSTLAAMSAADVWMLAVPDPQISLAACELAQLEPAQRPALVFHCSGALSSAELATLRHLDWWVASAHCLLSFANPATAIAQFAATPCALEGDAAAVTELKLAFARIDANCFEISAQNKLLYHAGAVFATNFLPVLQDLADQLWRHSGMPEALLQPLHSRLLSNAVNNILRLGPAGALTGPAARGDLALVAQQGKAVSDWDPEAGAAYQALSSLAARLAAKH